MLPRKAAIFLPDSRFAMNKESVKIAEYEDAEDYAQLRCVGITREFRS